MAVTAYLVSHRDPNLFSAVPAKALGYVQIAQRNHVPSFALPAKAGIQGGSPDERSAWPWVPAFAGTAEKILESRRFFEMRTYPSAKAGTQGLTLPSFPRKRESIGRRTIAAAEVDWLARSLAREIEGKL
jgi:hypothetical protein